MNKQNIKAILFDFDGTLADTMQDNFLAWKKAFQQVGFEIRAEDYFPLEGMKLIDVAKTLSDGDMFNGDLQEIVRLKDKFYLENYNFSLYPGVEELINFLKKENYRLAIVTASANERLRKSVPSEFLEYFDVIITGDDTEFGKPHPAPYLKALEKLSISPQESFVVENAPLGISSAKNAEIYCIALENTMDKKFLGDADIILKNILCLKEFLDIS